MPTHKDDDMSIRHIMEAVLKGIFGTNAEMEHPHSRQDVKDKILEAHESIDTMRASTDRLAKLQPAKNLDEAIRQLTEIGQ
jgi:hypothetical protein